jgi:hypothetical protein
VCTFLYRARNQLCTSPTATTPPGPSYAASARLLHVTLLADLDAFLQEHRPCGVLDSAVDGDRVWMTCTCGAVINRCADDD